MYGKRVIINGVSLVELVICIAIIAILLLVALPSYLDYLKRQRVNGIGDNLHFLMRLAKVEAAKKNSMMWVEFHVDPSDPSNWCVALSDTAGCTCAIANSCQLNGISRLFSATKYQDVTMTTSRPNISISPTRGRGLNTTVTFAIDTFDIKLIRNIYGRDRICTSASANLRHPPC